MFNQVPLFDSHFHIINRAYPLVANNGYRPEEFSCAAYLRRMQAYDLCGGVIVSGSFQAFDQDYLADALRQLGGAYVGVTQLPHTVSDQQIRDLNKLGVRAVRFNLKRGGSADIRELASMAARIHEVAGWHVELYVDASELGVLFPMLRKLPALSIDHLGLSKRGFKHLLRLVELGASVKATGFGRLDFEFEAAIKQIYAVNPHALMFGTDLPSTRAPRPYADTDYLLVMRALGEAAARQVFHTNAINLYKPAIRY